MQKRTKTGFGGLQRVQFKFVIPHVQGNIKMLQLVQLYCQQDRFRAVPLQFAKQKGARKLAGQLAQSVMQCAVSTPCVLFLCSSNLLSIHSCEGRATVGVFIITSRAKTTCPSLVSYGRRVISLLYFETSFLTLQFLLLRLRLAIPLFFVFFNPSVCLSLAVSLQV